MKKEITKTEESIDSGDDRPECERFSPEQRGSELRSGRFVWGKHWLNRPGIGKPGRESPDRLL
jgi:hypothetical protein